MKWLAALPAMLVAPLLPLAASATDLQAQHEFRIPAQSLETALLAFSDQAGVQVLMWAGARSAAKSPGVSGDLTALAALKALLGNTGLKFQQIDEETVAIVATDGAAIPAASGNAERQWTQMRLAQLSEDAPTGTSGAGKPQATGDKKQPDDDESVVIEEIIVTAAKREERLQRVPQAITAVTAERLDQLNAQTFADYFRDVPGLMMIDQGNGRRDFSLRGVSSGQINTNPTTVDVSTVSQYFDEIPVTASGFQMDPRLVDVDRIEVLRGPQGTYYGEGALGGMIRTITRKPVLNRYSAAVEGRVSQIEDGGMNESISGFANLPLGSRAALRMSGFYAEDGGYIDAVTTDQPGHTITGMHNEDLNDSRSTGFRGVLRIEPTDFFSISAQAAHFESKENFGVYLPALGDLLFPVRECPSTPVTPPPSSPPPDGGGGSPPPGGGAPPPDGGGDTSTGGCVGGTFVAAQRKGDLYNLTLEGDLGWATLVSASSYAETGVDIEQRDENIDGSGTRYRIQSQGVKAFTQEVRLVSSKAWSERWDYVVGAYYQDKDTGYDYPIIPNSGIPSSRTNSYNATEMALFADAGYMLNEHLQARLGIRGSDVTNEGVIDISPPNPRHITADSSFNPVTGRAVLTYFINPDLMTYTSIARGFRNGTLNDTTINFVPSISSVPGFTPIPESSQPDTNTTYEFGWKLGFPAHRMTINGAVYHTDWKDMQVMSFATTSSSSGNGAIPPGIAPAFVNAPRARVDGLELEVAFELFKGMQARAQWSFIDAVLTEDFPLNLQGVRSELHARKGDRIPFVSRSSGGLSLSYRRPVFGSFDGFAVLYGQYQSERATDFNKVLNSVPPIGTSPVMITTYFQMPSYWTTGLQLGIEKSRWRAALTLDNMLNDRADLFLSDQSKFTNRPRTLGLFVRRNFN